MLIVVSFLAMKFIRCFSKPNSFHIIIIIVIDQGVQFEFRILTALEFLNVTHASAYT